MWCGLMVRPRLIPESHHNFICGDDASAKAQVCALLTSFGWQPDEIIDLGDITAARAVEAWLPLCSMIAGAVKGPFNIKILPVPGN
jgi:8-hydroxy-5-deazaflavin:NADPH oxidoreductase